MIQERPGFKSKKNLFPTPLNFNVIQGFNGAVGLTISRPKRRKIVFSNKCSNSFCSFIINFMLDLFFGISSTFVLFSLIELLLLAIHFALFLLNGV